MTYEYYNLENFNIHYTLHKFDTETNKVYFYNENYSVWKPYGSQRKTYPSLQEFVLRNLDYFNLNHVRIQLLTEEEVDKYLVELELTR